jgi:hypothetical protein
MTLFLVQGWEVSGGGGRPDQGLPGGGWGGHPSQGLPGYGHPGQGLPGYGHPDQGLPGGGGHPSQGLPWAPVRPDQGLPGQGGHPDQGLPGSGMPGWGGGWGGGNYPSGQPIVPGATPHAAAVPPPKPAAVDPAHGVWVLVSVQGALAWAWAQPPAGVTVPGATGPTGAPAPEPKK